MVQRKDKVEPCALLFFSITAQPEGHQTCEQVRRRGAGGREHDSSARPCQKPGSRSRNPKIKEMATSVGMKMLAALLSRCVRQASLASRLVAMLNELQIDFKSKLNLQLGSYNPKFQCAASFVLFNWGLPSSVVVF